MNDNWHIAVAWDINRVYREFLDQTNVKRIEKIEMFDEFEEWHIFMAHYCVCCAIYFPNYIKDTSKPKVNKQKIVKENDNKNSNDSNNDEIKTNIASNDANESKVNSNDNDTVMTKNINNKDTDSNESKESSNEAIILPNAIDNELEVKLKQEWCNFGLLKPFFNPAPLILNNTGVANIGANNAPTYTSPFQKSRNMPISNKCQSKQI